ncbi:MAG: cystathionine beta-synthase, core [Satyrvirus sp.]|uniref:Cystathionine beta-synthase, core n=1 Tax=Satyrvirus sp. TaxID=2487771 RepID=A0A3G5AEN0_9VIRU|nr:MAG: cystathionine beta-synthase, core [Satyrvirus sp.]
MLDCEGGYYIFIWPYRAGRVQLYTSINNWSKPYEMIPIAPTNWVICLKPDLGPGSKHEYKYIVNGQWQYDPQSPICTSTMNTINNYFTVGMDN